MGNLALIDPTYRAPALREIPEEELCRQLTYMLAGIPTATFTYSQQLQGWDSYQLVFTGVVEEFLIVSGAGLVEIDEILRIFWEARLDILAQL